MFFVHFSADQNIISSSFFFEPYAVGTDNMATTPTSLMPTASLDIPMTSCEDDHNPSPPQSFPFPFTPYDIQEDFMRNLYATIEDGKIGIFESPTGTVEYC